MAHAYTAAAIDRIVRLGVRSIDHANLIDRCAAETKVEHDAFMVPTPIDLPPKNWVIVSDQSWECSCYETSTYQGVPLLKALTQTLIHHLYPVAIAIAS